MAGITRTLITGAVVYTCDSNGTVVSGGDVVIDGDSIAYVGPHYEGPYDVRLPAAGKLIMPGLINAHTHSPMTLFRGLSDDVTLQVFLADRVWPRELILTPDEAYAGSVLSGVEMLLSGVTTYVDMYFFEEALVRSALDVGLRALITPGLLDVPGWTERLGSWERRLADVVSFAQKWDGHDGRLYIGLGPHAPYTMSLPALAEVSRVARETGLTVHIHLVETEAERRDFNARGLGSTVHALNEVGFFDAPVLAAHSVWLDAGDIPIYQQHGVGVAHCPQSNAKLGAGIAPLARMLAGGVEVGLGTDGAATNNNLDLWEEVRLAPLLAKAVNLDPTLVSARQSVQMATSMGSRAVHLPHIGVLEAGRRADILLMDLSGPESVPIFDDSSYAGLLAYTLGRDRVDSVWVNGRRVLSGGEIGTVDVEKARRDVSRAALAIARRLEA